MPVPGSTITGSGPIAVLSMPYPKRVAALPQPEGIMQRLHGKFHGLAVDQHRYLAVWCGLARITSVK
jgi:hypothetical protein